MLIQAGANGNVFGYNYSYDYYANADDSTPLLEDESEYVLDESSESEEVESVHTTKDQ